MWHQGDGTRYNIWANRFVAVDTTPPSILLSSPSNGSVTNLSSIWVAGTAEVGAQVSVNGVAAGVGADGSFGLHVALRPGANLLVATAWDTAGNSRTASVSVTFQDPVPGLIMQLAAAQAGLASAEGNLSVAQAELAAEEARVAALEAGADATQAELASARSNLTAAQTRVTALEADVISTRAQLNLTQAALDEATADLSRAEGRLTTLETKTNATETDLATAKAQAAAASGQVGLATLLGAAGIILGVVSLILALRRKRDANPRAPVESPPTASKEPPPK